eukprot:GHVS01050756.1.p1 GENE.GHVS01050756.1~~GHVS01050756.1.p1  ORF type:complete len:144 (+),score=66.35 GHVS01050756.1:24-434(+)
MSFPPPSIPLPPPPPSSSVLPSTSSPSSPRCSLLSLSTRRDAIESEMASLSSFLCQPNYPGLTEPLVDKQGFPRADIDVYSVRMARHRLSCLKTDYERIMEDIKRLLETVYGTTTSGGGEANRNGKQQQNNNAEEK